MNPLRTVGGRLSLALALVVSGALLIAYLVVVPSLKERVIDARLDQLEERAELLVLDVQRDVLAEEVPLDIALANRAQALSVRLVRYGVLNSNPLSLYGLNDSTGVVALPLNDDPVAIRGAVTRQLSRGSVRRGADLYAELAIPFDQDSYLLIVAPLEDSLQNVELVERRILLAGAIALVIAVATGYVIAWLFARRIRRLERAADQIASGRFDEPVVDTGRDELGQLAQAFDRMRSRLAHLDHARREFIANASHELRTPLFSLGGMLELLDDEDLDDRTREDFLRSMRQQVQRLAKLATDLLDLTRLDAGRLHVEQDRVELGGLAGDLAEEFRALAQAREHHLSVGAAEATALADDQRVFQIGRILLENAILHTPAGTPIEIRVRAEDGAAVLEVADEGPGIPDEHVGHVFERFYRVDGALTSGSGLGLAIARELAELMGGDLVVESRPGRTVFRLLLPAAARPEPAAVTA